MDRYVLDFQEIDQTQVALVGGKGAHLGELSRIDGVRVPAGFCVTTDAFRRIMAEAPSIDDRLDRLSRLKPDDRETIRAAQRRSPPHPRSDPDPRRSCRCDHAITCVNSASKPRTPSDPARRRRTHPRHRSRVSTTRI